LEESVSISFYHVKNVFSISVVGDDFDFFNLPLGYFQLMPRLLHCQTIDQKAILASMPSDALRFANPDSVFVLGPSNSPSIHAPNHLSMIHPY
jgi:hypothetical protein